MLSSLVDQVIQANHHERTAVNPSSVNKNHVHERNYLDRNARNPQPDGYTPLASPPTTLAINIGSSLGGLGVLPLFRLPSAMRLPWAPPGAASRQ